MINQDLIPRPLSFGIEPTLLLRKLEDADPIFTARHPNPSPFLCSSLQPSGTPQRPSFLAAVPLCSLAWCLNPTASPSRASHFVSRLKGHSCSFLSNESAHCLLPENDQKPLVSCTVLGLSCSLQNIVVNLEQWRSIMGKDGSWKDGSSCFSLIY